VGLFKVGSQLFTAEGPRAVEKLADEGVQIFLDLKFHDIPNTVAKAISGAVKLPHVRLLTLHASGGASVMQAAREAAGDRKDRPKLLAVTVLTSLDEATLREIGMSGPIENCAVALARLAKKAGMDGAVCSAHEARAIRRACGPKFIILIPGVRPSKGSANDQSRIATPAEAVRAGADYLVVGRPITAAPNPKSAVLDMVAEMGSALQQSP
jgi:orotidine-5'-phosphate decarboxylase